MAIIKGDKAATAMKDAIVLDLGDLQKQAGRILTDARAQADQIVADAQQQARQIADDAHAQALEQGRREGLEQGLAEGREQGQKEGHAEAFEQEQARLQQVHEAWSQALGQFEQHRQQLGEQAQRDVLELGLKFAEKLVHRIVEVDPTVVADQLAEAVNFVLSPRNVVVRINPADRPTLDELLPQLAQQFDQLQHARLADDPQIARGGCVITYGQGRIDNQLDQKIARLLDRIVPHPEGPSAEQAAEPTPTPDAPAQPAIDPAPQAQTPPAAAAPPPDVPPADDPEQPDPPQEPGA